jgi:hypothetical protein
MLSVIYAKCLICKVSYMLVSYMLSVLYAECSYAEYCDARYTICPEHMFKSDSAFSLTKRSSLLQKRPLQPQKIFKGMATNEVSQTHFNNKKSRSQKGKSKKITQLLS